MPEQWAADIHLTEGDAALLIARQFPALAPVRLEPFGAGWDNAAFLVNGRYLFRFPRRRIATRLLEREARILPLLAPSLPLPIPVPEYVGAPTAAYPSIFAGYPLIHGETADRCACADDERAALAPVLARFLAALHAIPLDRRARAWAPRDEIARADLRGRAPGLKARIEANPAGLEGPVVRALLDRVDELAPTPGARAAPCWVHGDFYARHLLLNAARRLAGVIDWGDVHVGDAAIDLSIAFSFLPPAARPAFRRAYGDIDDATWARARFRAIHYGAVLAEYGAAVDDRPLAAAGAYALRHAPVGQ